MSSNQDVDVDEPLGDIEAGEQEPLHQQSSQPVFVSFWFRSGLGNPL